MEAFDVLIVGGGPSGSTCAWKLRKAGLRPLVIDRKDFPRDKPCAGWITPQIVESLELDVSHYRETNTWQPITGFRCGLIGQKIILVDYQKPISFGIRRFEFDRYLLDRSGSERRLNEAVDKISRQGSQWVINDRYVAPMLVGAGGTNCPVARSFPKLSSITFPTVVAQELEFKLSESTTMAPMGELPSLYFCHDLLGYGWCFRKGDYLNIGIGRTDSKDFMTHVRLFREFLCGQGLKCGECVGVWKGHSYGLYKHVPRKLFGEGVLLLGDAAGLAYAQSGEGIRPAVESGLIAADTIIAARGDYRKECMAVYQKQLEARRGMLKPQTLLERFPASWTNAVAARMLASPWLSRKILMDRIFLHRSDVALRG